MVLTISYLATGSERMRALDAGAMLGAAVAELDFGAHGGEELALGLDVADLGDVFEDDLVFGEDGGGHAGERGVFGSGDFDGAEKRVAAAYYELVHLVSLRRFSVEMSSCAGTGRWDSWQSTCYGRVAIEWFATAAASGVTTGAARPTNSVRLAAFAFWSQMLPAPSIASALVPKKELLV